MHGQQNIRILHVCMSCDGKKVWSNETVVRICVLYFGETCGEKKCSVTDELRQCMSALCTIKQQLLLISQKLSSATKNIKNISSSYVSYVYWTVHHLDSWVKRDQLDVTCFIISLFNAQHVSDVTTSILRSLRLICWVISWVVLFWFDVCWCYVVVWLGWCGIRMQASAKPQRNTNTHRTRAIQPMK